MATTSSWIQGARPRTLPAAIAPVLVGTAIAHYAHGVVWWKAVLALVVAVALQVAVNYANDYSDGLRGTDDDRVGPLRLVGSGAATATQVKTAAIVAFGVAAVAGVVLATTTAWWLIGVGAFAMAAAWFYTGGTRPYGYRGFGEVGVFVFFGLVAVSGTAYAQTGTFAASVWWLAALLGTGVGALACAILVANNLRDIASDERAGKRTLAVLLGDPATRALYLSLHLLAYAAAAAAAALVGSGWLLLALLGLSVSARPVNVVRRGATGPELISVLKDTGLAELAYAFGLVAGLVLAAR